MREAAIISTARTGLAKAMRGGFNNYQSFLGDLSELNVWDYAMNDMDIMAMALCKNWT